MKKILVEEYEAREHYIGEIMLKAIDNAPTVTDRTEEVLSLQNTIAKLVDGIAENARPQGEWIFLKANEEQTDGYECSVCKATYHTKVPYFSEFNFCPNCGAKMKGGAE